LAPASREGIHLGERVFTSEAVDMLREVSLGSLRDIDRVATAALKAASRRRRELVERDTVELMLSAAHED
jgi:general secretion pathway protein A